MRSRMQSLSASHLVAALERNPKNPVLHAQLLDALLEQQRFREAAEAAIRSIQLFPNRFADTMIVFEKAALSNPYNLSIRLGIADIYQSFGYAEDAVLELEDVLELDPNRIEAAQALSRLYYKLGRGAEVVTILDKVSDWSRADLAMLQFMAKAYFRERMWEKAARLYEHALNIQSDVVTLKSLYETYIHLQMLEPAVRAALRIVHEFSPSSDWVREQLEKMVRQFPAFRPGYEALVKACLCTLQGEDAVRVLREMSRLPDATLESVAHQLEDVLRQFPDFAPALYELALIDIRMRSYSRALERLDFLRQQHWDTYHEKIFRCLDLILSAEAEQVLALRMLGDLHWQQGDLVRAAEAYRRLVAVSPTDRPALLLRFKDHLKIAAGSDLPVLACELAIDNNDYDLAQRWLRQLRDIGQDDGTLAYLQATVLRSQGKIVETLEQLKIAVELAPFDRRIHQAIREALAQTWHRELEKTLTQPDNADRIPRLYYEMGRIDEAADVIQRSGTEDVPLRFLLARCFKEMGRFDLALRQLKHLAELDPRRILFELGTLHETMGDLDQALETYKNLQQLDLGFPGLAQRIEAMGSTTLIHIRGKMVLPLRARFEERRLIPVWVPNPEVEQWVKKVRQKLSPSLANPHNDRAVQHLFSGQWKAAEEELMVAQNLDPSLTAVQINWTTLALLRGDLAAAKEHLDKARNLNPKMGVLNHLQAMIHLSNGEDNLALAAFRAALSEDRRNWAALLNVGDLYYRVGKMDAAIDHWQEHLHTYWLAELAYRRLRETRYDLYSGSLLQTFKPLATP